MGLAWLISADAEEFVARGNVGASGRITVLRGCSQDVAGKGLPRDEIGGDFDSE